MCVISAAAAGTAAAAMSANISIASLAIGTLTSVAGMAQQQAAANAQAQAQLQQQRQAATRERQAAVRRHTGEVKAQQAQANAFDKNVKSINEGLNRAYVQQQVKEKEARTKAAFKSQEILAKSIASQGSVLATGATGQSIGLMALDAERQSGFATAEQDASIESARMSSAAQADMAFSQAQSQMNSAYSQLSAPVQAPIMAEAPGGPLGIPEYNWS